MWKTKLFLIIMPTIYTVMTSSGMFQVVNPRGFSHTPALLVVLACISFICAVFFTMVLMNTKDEMAKLRSKMTSQQKVTAVYEEQLKKLTEDSNNLIKEEDDIGTNIPVAQMVEQIGALRLRMADADAIKANASVTYNEWKYGPFGIIAEYYWKSIIQREIKEA